MSEALTIASQSRPVTVASLTADFQALGVQPGMTLLLHSSLRALGWVCGGPVAVILALEEVLGQAGTLVMPTHCSEYSDPAGWSNPPVPSAWWPVIRAQMPAFAPDMTPTRRMGQIPECFRKQPGVLRSQHPQVSFAAWGRHAAQLTDGHALPFGLGEDSPLARLYEQGGHVLLLGVGHEVNTSLHLAEYRARWKGRKTQACGAPVTADGERQWVEFSDIELDESDFPVLGAAFELSCPQAWREGQVGQARARLCRQPDLVDFAVGWMERFRSGVE